ncbi:MAG: hypothetical protein JNK27_11120 [Chitinophagaceae bacterium]|nr:hypothetical protein [Chitinophagaceae bacterium]
MQASKIVQAVILMIIVALAASCATGKEYVSRLFRPANNLAKDTQAVAIRFLEIDNDSLQENNIALAKGMIVADKDSTVATKPEPVVTETKPPAGTNEPVAKTSKPGEVRTKRKRD